MYVHFELYGCSMKRKCRRNYVILKNMEFFPAKFHQTVPGRKLVGFPKMIEFKVIFFSCFHSKYLCFHART